MTVVVIKGWKPGFNKVQFNKLLQEYGGFSLSAAMMKVDHLLEGCELHVEIEESKLAEFKLLARQLGAVLE